MVITPNRNVIATVNARVWRFDTTSRQAVTTAATVNGRRRSGVRVSGNRRVQTRSAAAATAGLTVEQTLQAFGHHWVKTSNTGVYANVMAILGGSLLDALRNLDRMHASIQIAMPDAQLPQFVIVSQDERAIKLAYYSTREGLESFVLGLLEGLLNRYNQPGSVVFSGTDGEARLFTITLAPPLAA